MKRASRLISLLLCAVLVFSTLCVSVSAETEYAVGDIVEFGSYPQTQITDDALISELEKLPRDEQGEVYFNGVRYFCTSLEDQEYYYNSFWGKFKPDISYWFAVEPIEWRVVRLYGKNAMLLLTNDILDCGSFDNDIDWYDCWWSNQSYMYDWLQDNFANRAFKTEDFSTILSSVGLLAYEAYIDPELGFEEEYRPDPDTCITRSETRTCGNSDYAYYRGYANCYWTATNTDYGMATVWGATGETRAPSGDMYTEPGSNWNGIRPTIIVEKSALETEPEHECTYSTEWSFDEVGHWYDCTDSACEETTNYAEHSGGVATVNAKAVCEYCGTAYGEYAKASYSVEPVSDIAYCRTGKREYKVTVAGSPDKIQFIRYTGTTATFVRSQAAEITDNGDGTETWILSASLNKGGYTLAAKYGSVWNKNGCEFEIVFDTPSCRSFTSEKTGELTTFTAVTDPQVTKIQLITQSGNTLTYGQANSYIGEDGLRYWTVIRKITKSGTIGLKTKYGYTWTTTNFTIEV